MNTTEQNAAKNTEAQVRRVLDVMNQGKLKQAIRITATPSQQPLPKTASKFGGVPYLPVGESAPTNASGQPLGMIAQINCAQLPQNNIYPKSGMLQFWIDPHDTVWGYNYNKPAVQENWRVLYYESVGEPNPDAPLPVIDWDTIGWPIEPESVEFALSFSLVEQGVTGTAHYYYPDFARVWDELYPEDKLPTGDDERARIQRTDAVEELTLPYEESDEYSRIGGYPYFIQNDPRDFDENLQGHTVNLLTIVSEADWESEEETPELLWGDAGSANWLITPEQLAAADFSNVIFEWSSC